MRQAILADRPFVSKLGWTIAAIIIPTAVRWVIDRGESGIPFVTYFPAVLLVSVFIGWRYAAIAALGSAIIANRLLREDPIVFYVSGRDALMVALFALACAIIVWAGETLRRLVRQQEEARNLEERLKRELLHRGRNMITVVQSLATLTARSSEPEQFVDKLNGRLQALAKANSILEWNDGTQSKVSAIIENAVSAFREDGNFHLSGAAFELPEASIVPLSLALHELCTNAVKYGALSVSTGRVEIAWKPADESGEELVISWLEIGGPKVEQPSHPGLGTQLLRPQNGLKDVRLEFHGTGLECVIVVSGTHSPQFERRNRL